MTSLIVNVTTATGSYLARLLDAFGEKVIGSGSENQLLATLGIADSVEMVRREAVADIATGGDVRHVYHISTGTADDAGYTGALATIVSGAKGSPRLCHVIDEALLPGSPAARQAVVQVIQLRQAGKIFAVNALLSHHDSRLQAPRSTLTELALLAFRIANGETHAPMMMPATARQDWGWTPEYVDALRRVVALDTPHDVRIGSGVLLSTDEMVEATAAYFGISAAQLAIVGNSAVADGVAADRDRLRKILGWAATTTGVDLVRTICEGAAARAAAESGGL